MAGQFSVPVIRTAPHCAPHDSRSGLFVASQSRGNTRNMVVLSHPLSRVLHVGRQ
ncbi:hypothetical protein HYPSUDRAFT_39843 [Hypholoma sublateritium FD-334 SS-4]|uniref:Uncharacterized protein n=1 Tax=Hypholoma sublateritium (strain FD-334 SS-4) TaxID=945553 RepID=A0A0D2NY28_HYPSF|nr:hypothetical protein HYPSUDRAFT_39843 [Hypholoma sublateritium FD-334 SS-4]